MTEIQTKMKELQHKVFWDNYYVDIFNKCMSKNEMTTTGIENGFHSDSKIIDMCNDFWLDLPDTPAIRREPFWLLCEIAEHCFD